MNIRQAFLAAADHIERNPKQFNFHCAHAPRPPGNAVDANVLIAAAGQRMHKYDAEEDKWSTFKMGRAPKGMTYSSVALGLSPTQSS